MTIIGHNYSLAKFAAKCAPALGFAQASIESCVIGKDTWYESSSEIDRELSQLLQMVREDMKPIDEEIQTKLLKNFQEAGMLTTELKVRGDRLAAELVELDREKRRIEEQKSELARRELIYSTGFYTSLGAIVIGIIGAMFRFPLIALERKQRRLEIEQLELALDQQRRQLSQVEGN